MDTLTTACRLVALIAMWDPYEYRDTTEGEENDILEMRRALNEGKTDKIVEKLKERSTKRLSGLRRKRRAMQ